MLGGGSPQSPCAACRVHGHPVGKRACFAVADDSSALAMIYGCADRCALRCTLSDFAEHMPLAECMAIMKGSRAAADACFG
jgi:hypothetical protein